MAPLKQSVCNNQNGESCIHAQSPKQRRRLRIFFQHCTSFIFNQWLSSLCGEKSIAKPYIHTITQLKYSVCGNQSQQFKFCRSSPLNLRCRRPRLLKKRLNKRSSLYSSTFCFRFIPSLFPFNQLHSLF